VPAATISGSVWFRESLSGARRRTRIDAQRPEMHETRLDLRRTVTLKVQGLQHRTQCAALALFGSMSPDRKFSCHLVVGIHALGRCVLVRHTMGLLPTPPRGSKSRNSAELVVEAVHGSGRVRWPRWASQQAFHLEFRSLRRSAGLSWATVHSPRAGQPGCSQLNPNLATYIGSHGGSQGLRSHGGHASHKVALQKNDIACPAASSHVQSSSGVSAYCA
jgi:hypothetical protein